jgi:hypothetical protein
LVLLFTFIICSFITLTMIIHTGVFVTKKKKRSALTLR